MNGFLRISLSLLISVFVTGIVATGVADDNVSAEPRRFVDIHDDIRVFLKQEATAENDQQRMAAIRDICEVFVELKHDPRLDSQPVLRGYKNQLWTRLNKLKKEFKRYERAEKKEQEQAKRRSKGKDTDEMEADVEQALSSLNRQLSDQMSLVSYSSGGPVGIVQQSSQSWSGSAGGGAIRANATQLIEVIQTTIAPDSWDINGGEGTIFFYAPLNALVIRATSEVHENVGGIAGALRRAGR